MAEEEQRHRLVILGAGEVGKTSIVTRFFKGTFSDSYKATVEDLHCKDYDINGTIVRVDILDTAGNLAFPAMRRLSITTAHGFVLVYSITDYNSFLEVKQLWEQIKELRANYQELPCTIIGNKMDQEEERRVPEDEIMDWVRTESMESAHIQVSAKENRDIVNIFQKLLEQANIPNLRKLEPILKRRLSVNTNLMNAQRQKLKEQEESRIARSRSLIRRSSKPKVKHTGDPSRNDCVIC
jgi:small GTP-binding protein